VPRSSVRDGKLGRVGLKSLAEDSNFDADRIAGNAEAWYDISRLDGFHDSPAKYPLEYLSVGEGAMLWARVCCELGNILGSGYSPSSEPRPS
jgi:hypothetical protein